jgi:hypothetical protein
MYNEMKIIIFLDLQKSMYDFIIDPKFFQINNNNNFQYVTYIPLHLPGSNGEEKSVITRDIDTDVNLYKKVVELWKWEKEKESVIKTIEDNDKIYEKIKGMVLKSSQKR